MEFGRVPYIEKINFSLPADAVMTGQVLAQAVREGPGTIRCYVGGTGWGQPNWLGKVYPRGTKPKDFLQQYASQFNSIELNALWYNLQPKPVIEKWASQVDTQFRFCPKISNTISHELQLENAAHDTALFVDHMQSFGITLGPSFLQLSERFDPRRAAILQSYLSILPRDFRVCVELRHEDWFAGPAAAAAARETAATAARETSAAAAREISAAATRETWDQFFEYGIGTVITDTPGRRDVLHMRLTAPFAFIRYVGNSLDPTDFVRIDAWADRIRTWIGKGLREVYFFVHDHEERFSPELCSYAIGQFNQKCGVDLKPPRLLNGEPPATNLTLF